MGLQNCKKPGACKEKMIGIRIIIFVVGFLLGLAVPELLK